MGIQWRIQYRLCYELALQYRPTVCSQNIDKQIVNIADENFRITAFSVGMTILNQRII